ncbi:DEAD/DEAH box helicase [Deinococcus detaillensis]|uniref:DEAD/DEAH box helicase n=1 Tax=Deinococcus detaillensis TaxID=2592048 RepID=A0A553UPI9_9DEIO|nr:DEAD/DEAH box helicase [Deinococcus detaillensis]TSA82139.1 DEAD/DEAH box helicase [Deinococcus detaillensis]
MTVPTALDLPQTVGWTEVAALEFPARAARTVPLHALPSGQPVMRYLQRAFPRGIYQHQADAAACAANFENFAVTTGTASGKTLCFHLAAMESLTTLPDGKVIVLYPQKALGPEQEERWCTALQTAGIDAEVGRIDGHVAVSQREAILERCRVVIMTPDVMHAWLLSNLGKKAVTRFIRAVRLIIVDEVHTFSGVFGSNAAYLFRRFEHASKLLSRKRLQYVCSSATISDPQRHLQLLFGREFSLIGPGRDGSPKQPVSLHFLSLQNGSKDFLTGASHLLQHLAQERLKFLCFSDSRKQTENLAAIVARRDHDQPEDELLGDAEEDHPVDASALARLSILPYRSGYEARDRSEIQTRLARGQLDGVISTSALELGMDIPYLDAVVLLGIPASSTSFQQRVGRVGRSKPGRVFILSSGLPSERILFEDPQQILRRPPAASTLYLENPNIQCIHALCLGHLGGEHNTLLGVLGRTTEGDFESPVTWPDGFVDLVEKERSGTLPAAMQPLRTQAGEHPNRAFPLRDVETSFKVEVRSANGTHDLGTLSHSQMMREAYPGAVYLYATRAYRVTRINALARTIQVRPERRYSTKPISLPTLAYPNLDQESVHHAEVRAGLTAVDCDVMISESVIGFSERRGGNAFNSPYPLDAHRTGICFQQPRFSRNFYSTGVILHHAALQGEVPRARLAELVLEAFALVVPFESRDIGITTDKLRVSQPGLEKGQSILVVYDQTYGSLRLSSKLLERGVLERVFETAVQLTEYAVEAEPEAQERGSLLEIRRVLQALADDARQPFTVPTWQAVPLPVAEPGERVRVILAGSHGICLLHGNREMSVSQVYYSPRGGLQYKGRLATDHAWETHLTVVPVEGLQAIPGVSQQGWYDLDLGEVVSEDVAQSAPS